MKKSGSPVFRRRDGARIIQRTPPWRSGAPCPCCERRYTQLHQWRADHPRPKDWRPQRTARWQALLQHYLEAPPRSRCRLTSTSTTATFPVSRMLSFKLDGETLERFAELVDRAGLTKSAVLRGMVEKWCATEAAAKTLPPKPAAEKAAKTNPRERLRLSDELAGRLERLVHVLGITPEAVLADALGHWEAEIDDWVSSVTERAEQWSTWRADERAGAGRVDPSPPYLLPPQVQHARRSRSEVSGAAISGPSANDGRPVLPPFGRNTPGRSC